MFVDNVKERPAKYKHRIFIAHQRQPIEPPCAAFLQAIGAAFRGHQPHLGLRIRNVIVARIRDPGGKRWLSVLEPDKGMHGEQELRLGSRKTREGQTRQNGVADDAEHDFNGGHDMPIG